MLPPWGLPSPEEDNFGKDGPVSGEDVCGRDADRVVDTVDILGYDLALAEVISGHVCDLSPVRLATILIMFAPTS